MRNDETTEIYLEWQDITLEDVKGNRIISNSTGRFRGPGLHFIFGKFGSGKSSLMKILAGVTDKFEGTVSPSIPSDKRLWIPQFNVLMETETVRQTLAMYGTAPEIDGIQLPAALTDMDKFLDRRVNTLSGGQRKALIISRITSDVQQFSHIFLDEPTTGMDAENTQEVLLYLDAIARIFGVMIIAVVHNHELFSEALKSKQIYCVPQNDRSEEITCNCCIETSRQMLSMLFARQFRNRFFTNKLNCVLMSLMDFMMIILVRVFAFRSEDYQMGIFQMSMWVTFGQLARACTTLTSMREVLYYEQSINLYHPSLFGIAWFLYIFLVDIVPFHMMLIIVCASYGLSVKMIAMVCLYSILQCIYVLALITMSCVILDFRVEPCTCLYFFIFCIFSMASGGYQDTYVLPSWVYPLQAVSPVHYMVEALNGEYHFGSGLPIMLALAIGGTIMSLISWHIWKNPRKCATCFFGCGRNCHGASWGDNFHHAFYFMI